MKEHPKPSNRLCHGFTLVEALMAAVILIIGIAGAIGAITAGVRAQGAADFYGTATSLAQQKMAELECRSDLSEGEETGDFQAPYDNYKWSYEIQQPSQEGTEGLWYVKLAITRKDTSGTARKAEIETYLMRREP